jgi:hypothetical protein
MNIGANVASVPVISPQIYGLILTSSRLAEAILPEGMLTSPYAVLEYDATLTLDDPKGKVATFRRRQRIQFRQDGVRAIMDHAWGEGIVLTHYQNSAGPVEDSFRDAGKRHLVIGLKHAMKRGEELQFRVERKAMESFTKSDCVVETTIDHPIHRLSRAIIFPKGRPVQMAVFDDGKTKARLPIFNRADGRSMVGFELSSPRANTVYSIRWRW